MSEIENSKFVFTLPEGIIEYSRKSPLIKRLDREKEAWKFISEVNESELDPRLRELNRLITFLNCANEFSNLKNEVENVEDFKSVSGSVESHRDRFFKMPPWTDTPEGSAALRAKGAGHAELAIKIVGGVILKRYRDINLLNNINNKAPGIVGELIATANTACLYDGLVIKDAISRKISSLTIDASNEVDSASQLIDQAKNQIDRISDEAESQALMLNSKARSKALMFKRLIQSGISESEKLREKFFVQMRYRAPVKLWEDRQKLHQQNAKNAILHFYAGAVTFCIAFALIAIVGGAEIAEAFLPIGCVPEKPETCNGFSIKGMLLVATTTLVASVSLWLLRYKMKVHLSERHLALDAQERKAFAETFLALREDKSVSSEQEAVVLQSLFRPTQDGIIKDDNALDATPAGLISRLLAQSNPK
ncbi:MAG: DUF6161 domain-containing protein [Alphaproteobacteria bacterium]|nr:DUF6161 domain-containing protein [Alphaproteobacteria bacterium]